VSLNGTELFDGFGFGTLHGEVAKIADRGQSGFAGGLLSQIRRVKDLRPQATFCVYRGDGVDALAFYEGESLLLC